VTIGQSKCGTLLELAREYKFWIVSDEPYTLLHWTEQPPAPLVALDDVHDPRVVTLGSFSKILAPGMRLGWMHCRSPELLQRVRTSGVFSSGGSPNPLGSQLAEELMRSHRLDSHLQLLKNTMAHRSKALCKALRTQLAGCTVSDPAGGYFVWVKLPEGVAAAQLAAEAGRQGVAFCPGSSAGEGLHDYIRLSFAFYTEPELQEGVSRLARALGCMIA